MGRDGDLRRQPREWLAASAAVRGRSHAVAGGPCQDAASVARAPGALSVCVCDGAGSAALSHHGAQFVAREVAEYLTSVAEPYVSGEIPAAAVVTRAREGVDQLVRNHGGSSRDYACALMGLVIAHDKVAAVHIGDGVIAEVVAGHPRVLSGPDNGEFANVTTFITSTDALERVRVVTKGLGPANTSFALMTDGAATALYEGRTRNVSQVVEQVASWLDDRTEEEVAAALATALREHLVPKTHDDCTLAVVRRHAPLLFACPSCKRWDLVRVGHGVRRFRVGCRACGEETCQAGGSRGRPPIARQWVLHLALVAGEGVREISATTRIPIRTIRRWLRLAVRDCRSGGATPRQEDHR